MFMLWPFLHQLGSLLQAEIFDQLHLSQAQLNWELLLFPNPPTITQNQGYMKFMYPVTRVTG